MQSCDEPSWLLTIEFRYDNKQSVLTDIFLVGDNVCMLGITTILADTSIRTDTTKFDILTLLTLYVVSDGLYSSLSDTLLPLLAFEHCSTPS